VINAGRSGSGTAAQYLVLPRAPDLVILFFFLNDLAENYSAKERFEWDVDGMPVRMRGRRPLLLNFVRNQLARLPFMWTEKTARHAKPFDPASDTLAAPRLPPGPRVELMWQRSQQLVLGAARLSERADADFLLLVTPLGDQIGARELSPYAKAVQLRRAELGRGPQAGFSASGGSRASTCSTRCRRSPGLVASSTSPTTGTGTRLGIERSPGSSAIS